MINWLSDNVCTEISLVGRGTTLQGQSDWEKPLVGVMKAVRLKWTQKICLACARWLAWNFGFVFTDRAGKHSITIRLRNLKNYTLRQSSLWRTLTPEAVRTLNKLPKSVITSQRNRQSREGFPSDITQWRHQPEVSIDHAETLGNTRAAFKLNWKQVYQTNLYCG